jgi:hypothetical protein
MLLVVLRRHVRRLVAIHEVDFGHQVHHEAPHCFPPAGFVGLPEWLEAILAEDFAAVGRVVHFHGDGPPSPAIDSSSPKKPHAKRHAAHQEFRGDGNPRLQAAPGPGVGGRSTVAGKARLVRRLADPRQQTSRSPPYRSPQSPCCKWGISAIEIIAGFDLTPPPLKLL